MSNDHYSFEELADFVEGSVSSERRTTIESHLASRCDTCAPVVSFLEQFLEARQTARWPSAPENIRREMIRAFKQQTKPDRPPIGWPLRLGLATAAAALAVIAWTVLTPESVGVVEASLSEIAGQVEVLGPGSSVWVASMEGQSLAAGTSVRTGVAGSARIDFDPEVQALLGPGTILEMAFIEGIDGKLDVRLIQSFGLVESTVGLTARTFVVETPMGEVSGVDSRFSIEIGPNQSGVVRVSEGSVRISVAGQQITLNAGGQMALGPLDPSSTSLPEDGSTGEVQQPTVSQSGDEQGTANDQDDGQQ